MKKLLVIICVLLIIFVGMYIYKINSNQDNVTAQEVQNIQDYIKKIYMWKEVTGEALPEFDDINEAPDNWLWEVVKKDLEDYELTYEQIQQKSEELFGNNFSKAFPKDGTDYMWFDEETNKYYSTGIGLDSQEDSFFINKIDKTNDGYQVEIAEYIVDYSEYTSVENEEMSNQDIQKNQSDNEAEEIIEPGYNIYIKNLDGNVIQTVKSTESESQIIEIVKENIDKFSKKTVKLIKDTNNNIYVRQVERNKWNKWDVDNLSHIIVENCQKLSKE